LYKINYFNKIVKLSIFNIKTILDNTKRFFINIISKNKHQKNKFDQFNNLNTNQENNKTLFENIYKNKIWNNGDNNIPLSGPGSSIKNAIKCSVLLDDFIISNECKNILDLGCGDLTWISKTSFFNNNNINYTGVDIVENLINTHIKSYPKKHFIITDIINYKNLEHFDIIIIRDVIFHLKNEEILKILCNIKYKFKYLLITSCLNSINNDNFDKWHFAEKNIHLEPFNISKKFKIGIFENKFNRNVYIYSHNLFYNI